MRKLSKGSCHLAEFLKMGKEFPRCRTVKDILGTGAYSKYKVKMGGESTVCSGKA